MGQANEGKNKKGREISCTEVVEKADKVLTAVLIYVWQHSDTVLTAVPIHVWQHSGTVQTAVSIHVWQHSETLRDAAHTNNIHLPSCSLKPSVASVDRASLLPPKPANYQYGSTIPRKVI